MMVFDLIQTTVFLTACSFQWNWFGLGKFSYLAVPLVLGNIFISWVMVAVSDFRADKGSAVLAILENMAYIAFLVAHWSVLEFQVVPLTVLDGAKWVLPTIVVVINLGQQIAEILAKVPKKFTRVERVNG